MKKGLIIGVGILLVLGAAIQFIRPDRTNPPADPSLDFTSVLIPPARIQAILQRSCYDCHSHQTHWPWYSSVAPASWLVAEDVSEGRRHLNFSTWGTYPRGKRIARLEAMISELDRGKMPPSSYLLLHRNAALTAEEKEVLLSWIEETSDSLTNPTQ
jgi:hypothetical protein